MDVALEGSWVRLEPLMPEHADRLAEVALDESIWQWTQVRITTRDEMRAYVDEAVADRERGRALPFATVERKTGRVVGSSRLAALDRTHRRAEIGWTFVAPAWQRTAINTEAKLLMLRHAFGPMECMRVELKTDAKNARSRAAIERLGARFEGVFEKHMVCWGGRIRDTAWYAITDDRWPDVEARLTALLRARA